ncbi:MAG: hypothetical protein K0S63_1264, partial [Gammaproteobacteria bacterium]|nr:hypothetical protein [Gammaproteobacteria bacterium]
MHNLDSATQATSSSSSSSSSVSTPVPSSYSDKDVTVPRGGLFKDGNQKHQVAKSALEAHLKTRNLVMGVAIDNGDCFFDAVAQALFAAGQKRQNGQPHTIASLRQACSHRADQLNKPGFDNWVELLVESVAGNTGESYRYYLENINKPVALIGPQVIWGGQVVDGRILCNIFTITLHVVQIEYLQGNLSISHILTTKNATNTVEENTAYNQSGIVLRLANYQGSHYVPLFPAKSPLLQNVERPAPDDSQDESKGEGIGISCLACTFLNSPQATVCKICGQKLKTSPQKLGGDRNLPYQFLQPPLRPSPPAIGSRLYDDAHTQTSSSSSSSPSSSSSSTAANQFPQSTPPSRRQAPLVEEKQASPIQALTYSLGKLSFDEHNLDSLLEWQLNVLQNPQASQISWENPHKPKIYVLRSGDPSLDSQRVKRQANLGKNDSFFHALGLDGVSREILIKKLRLHTHREDVRASFALEIYCSLYLSINPIPIGNREENRVAQSLLYKFQQFPILFNQLKTSNDEEQRQIIKKILALCSEKTVFEEYLNLYLDQARGSIPLAYRLRANQNYKTPIDLINYLFKLNVH